MSTSPRASLKIFPSSRVMSSAISSTRRRAMSAARQITRPRSGPGVFRHPWKAAAAASMARSVSAAVAMGNSAMTSRVSAGLTLRICLPELGWYHSPLMYEPVCMRVSLGLVSCVTNACGHGRV